MKSKWKEDERDENIDWDKIFMMRIPSNLLFFALCISRLIKTETGRAILRVIAGPRAFKVVLFARLTPIPFGLQNTIFGVSN